MPKRLIRQQHLRVRGCLTAQLRESYSRLAQKRLLNHPLFGAAEVVALYAPIRCEVDTALLLQSALSAGKRVVYPRVQQRVGAESEMDFIQIASERELRSGAFGVMEPCGDQPVAVSQIDLVVVPGVVFDRGGHRLGYGKGFYDRAVEGRSRRCVLCGLGYGFQVEKQLPHEDHDLVLDWLITDHETMQFCTTVA